MTKEKALDELDSYMKQAVDVCGWWRVHFDWILGCVCCFIVGLLLGIRFF